MSRIKVVSYPDGSCWNTDKDVEGAKEGGVGVVLSINNGIEIHWKEISEGIYLETTSGRMEMRAFLRTLEVSPKGSHITVYTDYKVIRDAIMKKWIFNWMTPNKNALLKRTNGDLWYLIATQIHLNEQSGGALEVKWVRGHDGNKLNERADQLANKARTEGKERILCRKANIN